MEFLIIENNPLRVKKFEQLGINTIFIDLEKLGKQDRQGHIDSVKSNHTYSDIENVKNVTTKAKVLVRIDPINKNSKEQINKVIDKGADSIMLPYFTKFSELEEFVNIVNNRIEILPLFEHFEALKFIEKAVVELGLKQLYFGLNDLSLSLDLKFMFQVLSEEYISNGTKICRERNVSFGIGGIGEYSNGIIPGKVVIKEYSRLGATSTIISRGLVKIFDQNPHLFEKNLNDIKIDYYLNKHNTPLLIENLNTLKDLTKNYLK